MLSRTPSIRWLKDKTLRAMYRVFSSAPLRHLSLRSGWILYNAGRRRYANLRRHHQNGESLIQAAALTIRGEGDELVVFDVGANIGSWSGQLISLVVSAGRGDDLWLTAFEPVDETFATLTGSLVRPGTGVVDVVQLALSDKSGQAEISLYERSGINSLEPQPYGSAPIGRQSISTTTGTEYAADNGIGFIHLMKVDAEGHDLAVIQGCIELLENGRIGILQFEYNHRWIPGRRLLKDVFDTIDGLQYSIGFASPHGVVWVHEWKPIYEDYFEANWVLVRNDLLHNMKSAGVSTL